MTNNRFGLSDKLIEAVRQVCSTKEELKGDQHKLDVAEPKGKLTSADFHKLRGNKEQVNVKPDLPEAMDDDGWYAHREIHGNKGISAKDWKAGWRLNSKGERVQTKKEEVEQVDEREMTAPEMKKREEIVKSMKKNLAGFKERYGKRGKDVMYATATKMAMKDEVNEAFVNHREYAALGKMHPTMAKSMKVGSDVDFYKTGSGDKTSGIVKKNDGTVVHIKQHGEDGRVGTGQLHKFKVES